MNRTWLAISFLAAAVSVHGQPLERGDILVTADGPGPSIQSRILVYGNDGTYKWQLATSDTTFFRETLFHNGVVYVGTNDEIKRFSVTGTELGRFNGADSINYLSPVADGSIVGSNGSGEVFHFNADGSLRASLRFARPLTSARGVDMAPDQCSIYYAGISYLAVWNACTDAEPIRLGDVWPSPALGRAMRILRDSFLVAQFSDVVRLDAAGNVIHRYGIPAQSLALDVNGRSFWAGAAGTLVKASIDIGEIEQLIHIGERLAYLSVVGEPRAALGGTTSIPTLDPRLLALLAAAVLLVAWLRLR